MWWFVQFLLIAVVSFFFWKFVAGGTEGENGKLKSLKFEIGKYTIWFHHWVYSTIALIILFFFDIFNPLIYGVLIGAIVQGLTYKDFYYIFFKTKNYPFKKL